ncbi:MAG TPA: hypothetical protein PLV72_02455 [Candidatus Magasanikbacteria bacterium]|nr:hypothetical protein [Candidatus Magasanikbacteria bacterium]
MGFWDEIEEAIFGGEKETHADGTVTERYSGGDSRTLDADGNLREYVTYKTVGGTVYAVTTDGDGNEVNRQETKIGK